MLTTIKYGKVQLPHNIMEKLFVYFVMLENTI